MPGTNGSPTPRYPPRRLMISAKFTPAHRTSISTLPGERSGTRHSRSRRTSASPNSSTTTAFIACVRSMCHRLGPRANAGCPTAGSHVARASDVGCGQKARRLGSGEAGRAQVPAGRR